MANNYRILEWKTDLDGITDLGSLNYSNDFTEGIKIEDLYIVNEWSESRPDIIAFEVYDDVKKLEPILKLNDITNPLAIQNGDLLLIPNRNWIETLYHSEPKPYKDTESQWKKKFIDASKKPDTNKARSEYLEVQNLRKARASEPVPPSFRRTGDVNIEEIEGKILLGRR